MNRRDRLFLMFCGIVAMKAHPRNGDASINLGDCMSLALAALEEFEDISKFVKDYSDIKE